MRPRFALILLLLLLFQKSLTQEKPAIPYADRIRLAEAFKIAETLGNQVWKDWDTAPFAVLLITPKHEFLIRHPRPSDDFDPIGYDSLLESDVYFRKRTFPTTLLATFPAVGGISTIVIGQAENTLKKTSTPWVVTVLHEHLHQLQNSRPDYYDDVNALNLSRGDKTGMWMLNYPFPYDSLEIGRQLSIMGGLLVRALNAEPASDFSAAVAAYLESRRRLKTMLSRDDFTYFSFQVWQEGIARYTEYRMAGLAGKKFRPSKEFRALKDYEPFEQVAENIKKDMMQELSTMKLSEDGRAAFYPLGAGEGLLLDRTNPKWKDRYFVDKFFIDEYFDTGH
jgi:hypothetical protein